MQERKARIINEDGLHMKPSMDLTVIASTFNSRIKLYNKKNMEADAKSIMQVSILGALHNEELRIVANGSDEEEAVEVIEQFIKNGFVNKVKSEI